MKWTIIQNVGLLLILGQIEEMSPLDIAEVENAEEYDFGMEEEEFLQIIQGVIATSLRGFYNTGQELYNIADEFFQSTRPSI